VEFIQTLERLEEEYREEGSTKILAGSLNTLLCNWLVGHIETVDRKFASFVRLKMG
jgi:hemerythrin